MSPFAHISYNDFSLLEFFNKLQISASDFSDEIFVHKNQGVVMVSEHTAPLLTANIQM